MINSGSGIGHGARMTADGKEGEPCGMRLIRCCGVMTAMPMETGNIPFVRGRGKSGEDENVKGVRGENDIVDNKRL